MPIKHILVVDDSPTERHFITDLLSRHGYSVSTADNAEVAMLKIKAQPPQLILMDVVMPGLNGFHATREIARGNGATPRRDSRGIPARLTYPPRLSFVSHLPTPFSPNTFVREPA